MNRVLSLLMTYVFLQTQAWSLSGGPFQNNSGPVLDVVGTYSGILVPTFENGVNVNTGDTEVDVDTPTRFNSIGIFSLGVPEVGIATGAFAFFGNAQVYNGTITGVVDPDDGSLNAILDAPTTLRAPGATTGGVAATYVGQALGSMQADIVAAANISLAAQGRLSGTAHLDVFEGEFNADLSVKVASTFDFAVEGFKQSDQVAASAISIGADGGG